jgi:uncharacterized SAM-binding protein YcdF (DUF218 family)
MLFFFLSKTLDVLVAPYTWVILLLVWAVVQLRRRRRKQGQRAILCALVVIYASSTGCTASLLTGSLEAQAHRTAREGVTYDAVVLLGGLMEGRSSPPSYNDAVERLLVTYDVLRTNRARFAIISSGIDGRGESEAALLARQLRAWGIDGSRLLLEEEAVNTHKNALYSKRIIDQRGFQSLLLVTSAMHMKRAAGSFRAVGLHPDLLPVDFRAARRFYGSGPLPRARSLSDTTDAIREACGWLVYWAAGWVA